MAWARRTPGAKPARMAESGTSISLCPTSQQFLGSGDHAMEADLELGVNISIGSGFRGRDEWLIPQVLWGQLKVAHSEPGDARIHCTPLNCCSWGRSAVPVPLVWRTGSAISTPGGRRISLLSTCRLASVGRGAGKGTMSRRRRNGSGSAAVRVVDEHVRAGHFARLSSRAADRRRLSRHWQRCGGELLGDELGRSGNRSFAVSSNPGSCGVRGLGARCRGRRQWLPGHAESRVSVLAAPEFDWAISITRG